MPTKMQIHSQPASNRLHHNNNAAFIQTFPIMCYIHEWKYLFLWLRFNKLFEQENQ